MERAIVQGATMVSAVLALGSNLGDRLVSLQKAVDLLLDPPDVVGEAISSVYETDPVGGPDQPEYLNVVLLVRTRLSPDDLLRHCQSVEQALHRVRTRRWGPRTIDVDVISYAGTERDGQFLTLPHPRAHERGFVLLPWREIDPEATIPGRGDVAELVERVDLSGVRTTSFAIRL